MAVVATSPVGMSVYIIAMAASARAAQAIMSTGADPMAIQKFKFKVNISTEITIDSSTEIKLTIWRLSINETIKVGYKSEWGLEIECEIIPVVSITPG